MHRFLGNSFSLSAPCLQIFGIPALLAGMMFGACRICAGQVFTVQRDQTAGQFHNLANIQPTSVQLGTAPVTMRTKEELIRLFQSEQAFAVRPLPLGKRGLLLHANGPLDPSGAGYVDELEKNGISSKPGDRLVISKFEITPDRIVFEFNGGPEKPHHILRHIQVGGMGGVSPVVQGGQEEPVGSRLTLVFSKFVPEMDATQLRSLIAPIVDFSLKTPVQAYADTLPPKLKNAVLHHQILVGMNQEMVIQAAGRPDQKVREVRDQKPFEEWIYGQSPQQVQFVQFNGDRVVRLEIANVGQPLVVRDKDETDGYWGGQFVHEVRLGDAPPVKPGEEHGPTEAPTLRAPGEKLPDANNPDQQLKRVQFPQDNPKPQPIPETDNTPSSPPPDQTLPGQAPASQGPANQGPASQGPQSQPSRGQNPETQFPPD